MMKGSIREEFSSGCPDWVWIRGSTSSSLSTFRIFSSQRDCTALPLYHCLLRQTYAMPPLNTTRSGKLPGFVATVGRRSPAEMIPKPFVPLSCWGKSSSWLFSYCLLDSVVAAVFLCDGRWRRSRRGGRGLCHSQSSGGPRYRIQPTSGQPRSHSQAAPTTPRPISGTSGRTGPRVPCRCACGLTRPRLAHLAFGCAGR